MVNTEYKCLNCGGARFERVIVGATVRQEVLGIDESGELEYSAVNEIADGDDLWFECSDCGLEIKDPGGIAVSLDSELAELLAN